MYNINELKKQLADAKEQGLNSNIIMSLEADIKRGCYEDLSETSEDNRAFNDMILRDKFNKRGL
jgi:hypothetical protein